MRLTQRFPAQETISSEVVEQGEYCRSYFFGWEGREWNHYVTQQHKSVIELVILFTLCLAIDYVYRCREDDKNG